MDHQGEPTQSKEPPMLKVALSYARRGWSVFPLHGVDESGRCACGDTGCQDQGKHPATIHGFKNATLDEDIIRRWWEASPESNIGIATGAISGIAVLDIDPRNGGDVSLDELFDVHGALPPTVEALTGDGEHFYFQIASATRSRKGLVPGIDLKADLGYVVGPPSRHASGRRYQWEISSDPADVALAPMPHWLAELGREHSVRPDRLAADGRIPQGRRNDTLTSIGGKMRRIGMEEPEIGAALRAITASRSDTPLPDAEVDAIAASVSRYAPDPTAAARDNGSAHRPVITSTWRDLMKTAAAGPREQLVEGLLAPGDRLLLYGPIDAGKSVLALELAIAIQRGEKFLGEMVTRRARVGVIDEESPGSRLGGRLSALLGAHGIAEGDDDLPRFAMGQGLGIDSDEGADRIAEWIIHEGIEVLVIDTLRRAIGSLREDSADDMNAAYRRIRHIQNRTKQATGHDLTVVLIHHTSKVRDSSRVSPEALARGSGDIVAGVDAAWLMRPNRGTGARLVTCTKSRWSARPEPFTVTIEDDEGALRVRYLGQASEADQQADVIEYIRDALLAAPEWTLSRKVLLSGAKTTLGRSERTVQPVLNAMVQSGELIKVHSGREVLYRLQPKEQEPNQ